MKYSPLLTGLKNYSGQLFRADLLAGLTVGIMLVPQGMAYALLAGLSPIYGLYGALIPILLYALLGSSRSMSIGPVAISSLLLLAGISQIAEPGSADYISFVILTGMLIGLIQVVSSILRLGFLVNFLSHPVIIGFTSAAAIIITISQLRYLLGIEIPRTSSSIETLQYAITHLTQTHMPTFLLCLGGIILITIFKKISKKIPGALIAVGLSIAAVALLGLDQSGISVVKEVPSGLPAFQLPTLTWDNIRLVLPTVFTVTVIGIVESISIAKVWESKYNNTVEPQHRYRIDPNQELLALGISKIGGSFFQAMPSSGSFSRSAVNAESGARTQMSSVIAFGLIVMTLLFLTPIFGYLPEAILASIIIISVLNLFEYKEAKQLWHTHRSDFYMMLLTFVVTLLLGIEEGVFAGVLFSVLMILYRNSKPGITTLGRLPGSPYYRNMERFPDALEVAGFKIIRLDSQLFFANASYFKDFIENIIAGNSSIEVLIIDGSGISDIDSSGLHMLEETHALLKSKNIHLYFAAVIGVVRDRLHIAGLMEEIGEENQFMTINAAVENFQKRKEKKSDNWTSRAVQTNVD